MGPVIPAIAGIGAGIGSLVSKAGPAVGAIAGGLSGLLGGGKQSSMETTQAPWSGAQPYYSDLYARAQEAIHNTPNKPYDGPLIAQPSDNSREAVYKLANLQGVLGQGGQPTADLASTLINHGAGIKPIEFNNVVNPTQARETVSPIHPINLGQDTQSGFYLNPSSYLKDAVNAGTDDVFRNFTRSVLPGLNSASIEQGAYGGARASLAQGLAASEAHRQAADAATQAYAQNYANERGLQETSRQAQTAADLSGQTSTQQLLQQQEAQRIQAEQQNTGFLLQQELERAHAAEVTGNQALSDAQLRFNAPQLFGLSNNLLTAGVNAEGQAGAQQDAWEQAKIDANRQQLVDAQNAPWAGLDKFSTILNGGNFSSTNQVNRVPVSSSVFQGASSGALLAQLLAGGGGGFGSTIGSQYIGGYNGGLVPSSQLSTVLPGLTLSGI